MDSFKKNPHPIKNCLYFLGIFIAFYLSRGRIIKININPAKKLLATILTACSWFLFSFGFFASADSRSGASPLSTPVYPFPLSFNSNGGTESAICAQKENQNSARCLKLQCTQSFDSFNNSSRELGTACGTAGLAVNGKGFMCEEAVLRCQYCSNDDDDNSYGDAAPIQVTCKDSVSDSDEDDEDALDTTASTQNVMDFLSGSGVSSFSTGKKDLSKARKAFANCRPFAAEYVRDNKGELRDSRENFRESQRNVDDLSEKSAQAEQEYSDSQSSIDQEAADLQKNATDDTDKIMNRLKNNQEKLEGQISELQRRYKALITQIALFDLSKGQLQNEYLEKRDLEYKRCYAFALEQADRTRIETLNKANKSVLKGNPLSSVKVSLSTRFQGYAKKIYQKCIGSENTTLSLKSAQRDRSAKLQATELNISKAKEEMESIIEEITNLKTNKMTQIRNDAVEDLQRVKSNLLTNFQLLDKKRTNLYNKYSQNKFRLGSQLSRASLELNDDKSEYQYQRSLYNLALTSQGSTGGIRPGSFDAVTAAMANVKQNAYAVKSACCTPGTSGDSNSCKMGCAALYSSGSSQYNECIQSIGTPAVREPATRAQ
ncbi:MAG: hypothetical protein K1X29_00740 [Bdellovibrionales bacterium]|nr:hypothetical protein [Bdellovibrionales bacterium]